ncbi:MAG: hypothetical protein COC16_04720 [Lutibacter sp.]|nr:MAG: hypothetical protein COC16_04720 [Lutibacter sp.]
MAFSFSTIFKSKKGITPSEEILKIEFKGGTKFAKNNTNEVYLDIEELGGFPFVKTIIIGDFSTKIKRVGCTLTFIFENASVTLNSDNTDIESNKIKNSSIYYTEIDFELNDEEAEKIKAEKVLEVQYTFKSLTYSFKTL